MASLQLRLCHDRIAVVGGGSGIGRATALRLAEAGATVYVLGRRLDALHETASLSQGVIVPVRCDALSPDEVDTAFRRMEADGPVQALAHCAAAVNYLPAQALSAEAFQKVVGSTLFTAFNTIHRWATALLNSGLPGVGLSLTSAMATLGTPGLAHSSAGKAGIEAFTKSVAREWAPKGLRLNVVGPGFFPIEKSRALWENDEASGAIKRLIAVGRLGLLDEIVGPIVFLLSDAASYITGETLVVDGGYRLQPDVFPTWTYAIDAAVSGIHPIKRNVSGD